MTGSHVDVSCQPKEVLSSHSNPSGQSDPAQSTCLSPLNETCSSLHTVCNHPPTQHESCDETSTCGCQPPLVVSHPCGSCHNCHISYQTGQTTQTSYDNEPICNDWNRRPSLGQQYVKYFDAARAKHYRDECGLRAFPKKVTIIEKSEHWCKTPQSIYQSTHGSLAAQIMFREVIMPVRSASSPPCNICEYIMPPYGNNYCGCCSRPSEEFLLHTRLKKKYGSKVDRYWRPLYEYMARK